MGIIERLDPAVDDLVPRDAQMEVIAEGLQWAEGPVWIQDGGFLLFSDVLTNTIHRWDRENRLRSVFHSLRLHGQRAARRRDGFQRPERRSAKAGCSSASMAIAASPGSIRRSTARGKPYVTVADRYDGKRFNSPNDLVVHSSGAIYFTDPPYGLERQMDDPAKELPLQGVYRIAPDGKVTLLTKELERPNGIGFSPDEKTLYVANSHGPRLIVMAFPVKAGRHARRRPRVLRCPAAVAKMEPRLAGRHDGRPARQRVGNGARRRRHPFARRQAPRLADHHAAHRQLQIRRRRLDAVHRRGRLFPAHSADDQRHRILTVGGMRCREVA